MSKRGLFSIILLFMLVGANAQFRKIPAEVTDAFDDKFDHATEVEWKDKITSFQAVFTSGDKEMKATFNPKGEWMKTETKVTFGSLPSDVKDGFKKSKYADIAVSDVSKVDEKDKDIRYRVVVKKNEFSRKNLMFAKNGQLLSDTGIM